jgi:rod shape-determining protein MreB
VGEEAKLMLGRTPGNIRAVRPLRDGVIADFDAAEQMIKSFIQKGNEGRGIVAPRLVIGIPSGVTGVERRAVREAGLAGAREVHLIDEPVAAAIGAGLPVTEPVGTMIVDIGGGTTEVAVLSLGGTVLSESVRVAGDELSDAIGVFLKKVHNLVVGERTAEDIKIRIGSAFADNDHDEISMDVRGLHLLSGLPRTINVRAGDIREAMAEPLNVIVEAVKRTLERTPPELAADIVDRGIMLAGGGALVRGISDLISHETGILTHVAEEPLLCVVNGCGMVLRTTRPWSGCWIPLISCGRWPEPDGVAGPQAAPTVTAPGQACLALAGASGAAAGPAPEQGRWLSRCLCPAQQAVLAGNGPVGVAHRGRAARPAVAPAAAGGRQPAAAPPAGSGAGGFEAGGCSRDLPPGRGLVAAVGDRPG